MPDRVSVLKYASFLSIILMPHSSAWGFDIVRCKIECVSSSAAAASKAATETSAGAKAGGSAGALPSIEPDMIVGGFDKTGPQGLPIEGAGCGLPVWSASVPSACMHAYTPVWNPFCGTAGLEECSKYCPNINDAENKSLAVQECTRHGERVFTTVKSCEYISFSRLGGPRPTLSQWEHLQASKSTWEAPASAEASPVVATPSAPKAPENPRPDLICGVRVREGCGGCEKPVDDLELCKSGIVTYPLWDTYLGSLQLLDSGSAASAYKIGLCDAKTHNLISCCVAKLPINSESRSNIIAMKNDSEGYRKLREVFEAKKSVLSSLEWFNRAQTFESYFIPHFPTAFPANMIIMPVAQPAVINDGKQLDASVKWQKFAVEAARDLVILNRLNMAHNDINGGNFLLYNGNVVLSDFEGVKHEDTAVHKKNEIAYYVELTLRLNPSRCEPAAAHPPQTICYALKHINSISEIAFRTAGSSIEEALASMTLSMLQIASGDPIGEEAQVLPPLHSPTTLR